MRTAIWGPMNTAPRDGTIVDLQLKNGGRYTDAWWEEEDESWCGLDESMFSHWAPLPRFQHEIAELEGDRRWLIFVVTCLAALGGAILWRIFS